LVVFSIEKNLDRVFQGSIGFPVGREGFLFGKPYRAWTGGSFREI